MNLNFITILPFDFDALLIVAKRALDSCTKVALCIDYGLYVPFSTTLCNAPNVY